MKAAYIVAFASMILLTGCAGRPMTPEEWAQIQRMWPKPMAAPIPAAPAQPANHITNCTSSVIGTQVYTTCY